MAVAGSLDEALSGAGSVVVTLAHPSFTALADLDLGAAGVGVVHDLVGLLPAGAARGARLRGP
jgi:hypothetical protein